jgi:signal peptidase II
MPSAAEQRIYWGTAAGVLTTDLVTKTLAESHLMSVAGRRVLGQLVQLRLVYNPGAAFGLDVGPFSRWIFMVVAVVAVIALYRMSRGAEPGDWFRQLALGLVSGGAIGNLVDRVRSAQGVVDFIDVGLGSYRWPTFNVADMAVSCGAIALAISLWREDARRDEAAVPSESVVVSGKEGGR